MSSNNIDNYSRSIGWIFEKVVWWHSCLQRFLSPKHHDVQIRLYELPIFKLRECNFRLECHRNSHRYKRRHYYNYCFVTYPVIVVDTKLTLYKHFFISKGIGLSAINCAFRNLYTHSFFVKDGTNYYLPSTTFSIESKIKDIKFYVRASFLRWPIYKSLALTLM